MSDTNLHDQALASATREEIHSALFATLVMQHANMALVMLGQAPTPDGTRLPIDIHAAKLFIDQLEMIEAKTKGNLTKDEAKILQQNLAHIRMSFVEAIEAPVHGSHGNINVPPPEPTPAPETNPPPATEEPRKRFSKTY